MVHLSPVPEGKEIHEYDGSGEWVKIHTIGLEHRVEEHPDFPVWWLAYNGTGCVAPDCAGEPPPVSD
jgi:hypothetical protein